MYIHICMSCLTVTLSQLIDLRVSRLRRLLDINLEIMQYLISRYSSNIACSNDRMIPFSRLLVTILGQRFRFQKMLLLKVKFIL